MRAAVAWHGVGQRPLPRQHLRFPVTGWGTADAQYLVPLLATYAALPQNR
jgi:hypothetical protein